jgi:hypothetical protein
MRSKSSKSSYKEDKNISKRETRLWVLARICALLCVFLPAILIPIFSAPDPIKAARLYFHGFMDVMLSFPYNLILVVVVISGGVALLSYIRPSAESTVPSGTDQSSGVAEDK